MSNSVIATISGVRLIHDESYKQHVANYTSAFCRTLRKIVDNYNSIKFNKNLVIVGRDGRRVSELYVTHVVQCLTQHGYEVEYIDVVPTPTCQQTVMLHKAAGAVIITASHNGNEWCGLKFLNPSSIFFSPEECELMFGDLHQEKTFQDLPIENLKGVKLTPREDVLKEHFDHVSKQDIIKADLIRQKKFKIAFNGQCASGAVYAPLLAKYLGLELLLFNGEVGDLPAKPEPTPANLVDFQHFLSQKQFDVGFAVDPDADRLVLTDENGCVINEELTLAICMKYYLSQRKLNAFVRNCSSSFISTLIAAKETKVFESKVGEVNVAMKMILEDAELGGEGNGGVILKAAHLGRDSIVGVLMVLSYLATSGLKMSEVIAQIPKMFIQKEKYSFQLSQKPAIIEKLQKLQLEGFQTTNLDGVKLVNETTKQWVQIRFSNTEHIFRIIAEAQTQQETQQLIKQVENFVLQ